MHDFSNKQLPLLANQISKFGERLTEAEPLLRKTEPSGSHADVTFSQAAKSSRSSFVSARA